MPFPVVRPIALALAVLVCAWLSPVVAAPILVSVKPLQMLVSGVTEGVDRPELLIPAAVSPHNYELRPSQVMMLNRAGVVFWFGPALEGRLAASLSALPAATRVETLLDFPALAPLPLREAEHEQDGHGQIDAHVWLDPQRAALLVGRIAEVMAAVDPGHAVRYRENAQGLSARLAALDRELAGELAPVRARPFWVYHDGYQYFERRYGLSMRGALNQNPELPLRPQALMRLSADREAHCLLLDRQYRQASLAQMLAASSLRLVELDPFGREQAGDFPGYEALMRTLSRQIGGCLAADAG